MMSRFLCSILFFLMLLSAGEISGQKKTRFFQIPGRVKIEKGNPAGTVVNLFNLQSNILEKSLSVTSAGNFDLELNYQTEYKLSIVKEGYYPKDILISTVIPYNVWQKDSVFPPFYIVVNLFKKVPGVSLSFEGKTIGKISYSPKGGLDNFDSDNYLNDKDIKEEIETAINNSGEDNFNKILAEALDLEKNNDLKSAYQKYLGANRLKPNDKFVREKLRDLSSDLKNELEDAKLLAEFNRVMELGNANIEKKNYLEAISNFKSALKLKPGETTATNKLREAEQLLAEANTEKAKTEEEFKRLVALGDENVSKKNYPEAIIGYNGALKIKPNDQYCLNKLSAAEKLLAQSEADRSKLEEKFKQLLASGDKNITDQKYQEAISDFKGALTLKPEDQVARQKLTSAEGLLAKLNTDKARAEEEFNRLVALGDENVSKKNYPEAISGYNGALKIKPSDASCLNKLSAAEKLLAQSEADKAKLEENFKQLLASGDKNITDQKYPEAISDFKGALTLKPEDPVARQKLTSAEGLLAKLNTDKARAEEEFNRLVALGDENVSKKNYPEAISGYNGALKIKPSDASCQAKLSAAEKLLAQSEADKAKLENNFKQLLASGDKNIIDQKYPEAVSNFKEALSLKPEDAVARQKLSSAEGLLVRLNAEKAMAEEEFRRLVALGDENVSRKNYSEAIVGYNGALKIKPTDAATISKLKDAEEVFSKKSDTKNDYDYQSNISQGDENYKKSQWAVARFYYVKALNVKPEDKYSITRLEACDKMIDANITADKLQQYTNLIAEGDKAFMAENYSSARFYYHSSLELLPWEAYPSGKLKEIDGILMQKLTLKEREEFKQNQQKADEALGKREYSIARFYYNKANEINHDEYCLLKLKEIENIINGSEEKRVDSEYAGLIKKANDAVQQKNIALARYYYQKAAILKPGETYSTEELKKLNNYN